MASPILPISDLQFPPRRESPLAGLWIQAEIADTECRAGQFREAAGRREKLLESEWCDSHLRNWVIEELVRDYLCLGERERAMTWAERLPESERKLYLGVTATCPDKSAGKVHRLFYFALSVPDAAERRESLSHFICCSFDREVRTWEIEEARKLATELARQQGQPYCVVCCRTASAKVELLQSGRGYQCAECISYSCCAVSWSQDPVAPRGIDIHKAYRMLAAVLRKPFRDEVPMKAKLVAPALEWSAEALACLEQAQRFPPPWTSLDLLRAVKQHLGWSALEGLGGERVYDPEEPIGPDGLHSKGWQRAVDIAAYLARWQRQPQPVSPQHLLAGLGWAEEGEASRRLLQGARALRGKLTVYLGNLADLPVGEIRRLERELQANPQDIFLRCQLLFAHRSPHVRNNRRCQREYEAHAHWLVQHRSDHPVMRDLSLAPLFEFNPEPQSSSLDHSMLQLLESKPEATEVVRMVARRWESKRPRFSRELLIKLRKGGANVDMELSLLCAELGEWQEALTYAKCATEKREGSRRRYALRRCFDAQLALELWGEAESTVEALGSREETLPLRGLLAAARGDGPEAERCLHASSWDEISTRKLLAAVRLEAALDYLENLLRMRKPPIPKGRIRAIRQALRDGESIRYH